METDKRVKELKFNKDQNVIACRDKEVRNLCQSQNMVFQFLLSEHVSHHNIFFKTCENFFH